MIKIPKHCTGFAILTKNDQPEVIEIKKGESRISSNIADPACATLGDHHHTTDDREHHMAL
jgi:hypothetical protein